MNCDFGVFMHARDTVEGAVPIQGPNEKSTPSRGALYGAYVIEKRVIGIEPTTFSLGTDENAECCSRYPIFGRR